MSAMTPRDQIYARLKGHFDRFPLKDSKTEQDLHAVDLDALNDEAARREEEACEKKEEAKLWEQP